MAFNIDEIDKSKFVTLKMRDFSVYFGEIAYLNENNKIANPEELKEEERNKLKRIRHGAGIQVFPKSNEQEYLCKYEGYWEMDRKHGEGKCYFPDQSIYIGNMNNDIMEGYGKFVWPNGDTYEGSWKNGRIEGGGKFTHNGGNVLQGLFKNNYFHKQSDIYLNPFMSGEQIDEILNKKREINIIKERNMNQKLFIFERCSTMEKVLEVIKKSNNNNRVPLVLSSKQLSLRKKEALTSLASAQAKSYYEFDLRFIYNEKKMKGDPKQYLNTVKNQLGTAMVKGDIYVINVDDSDSKYEEIYDPDVWEFYSPNHFPAQIWNYSSLCKAEIFEKIYAGTENKFMTKVSKSFHVIVWSKFKIDHELPNHKVIEKFERRFASIIPIAKIDLILLEEPPKVVEVEKPKEEVKEEIIDPKAKKVNVPPAKK